jgi:ribosomal protein L31E
MRDLAKPSLAKRRAKGAVSAPAEEVSRQAKENEGDVCLDNDLGAEWTGNIECEESAKRRSGTTRDR